MASQANQAGTDLGNLFSAKGLVVLITGGGTGIGYLMAKALAEAGAHRVYIVGRRVEVLQTAASSIGLTSVVPLYCDVTSKISLESVVSVVERDIGYLNLLVCNAGVGGPQVPAPAPTPASAPAQTSNANTPSSSSSSPFSAAASLTASLLDWRAAQMAVDVDDFTATFRANASATWFSAMAFLGLLDAGNKRGNVTQSSQVVVTGSIAAFNKMAPGGWAYGQSKAAATHAVKQLSCVLPTWDIRANCIAPGLFPSEMADPILARAGVTKENPTLDKSKIPMRRVGDDSDMAGAILYLATRAGAYCNGNVITVDGGRLTTFPSTW